MKTLIFKKAERGQSFVELAFILPILIVLFIGIVNFGTLYNVYNTLKDATQEGVNYASIKPIDTAGKINKAGIEARIRSFTNHYVDLKDTENVVVTIIPPVNPACTGKTIKIKVSTYVDVFTPFIGIVTGQKIQIKSESASVILNPACP